VRLPKASNVSAAAGVDGRARIEHLLRFVLEVCGAERAFLVERSHSSDAPIRLTASLCERGDGRREPSRSMLRRALAGSRAWFQLDVDRDDAGHGGSVRTLALRSVLGVPIPVRSQSSAALIVDSRGVLARPLPELRETLETLAVLIGLVARAATPRNADPGEAPVEQTRTGLGEYPSRSYRGMLAWLHRVAPSELPVLVLGESGSGKESVSRAVHRLSRRPHGKFLALNCSALTDTLLEAELFGARKGAYTGADRDRPGLFVQADGGTLFLDEVADMSVAMQAKLLRVLEEGRVRPVGATGEVAVDVRIVAASHRDLAREVDCGRFRVDLYYRLAVLRVEVPALRDRLDDLALLVEQLAPRLLRETGFGPPDLDEDAWRAIREYSWPGNVRQFHTVLARALLRTGGGPIGAEHLEPLDDRTERATSSATPLERTMIVGALSTASGQLTEAAARIGWSRQKLYRRMEALGIARTASA
jgi:DNA-binding NtrC family response regulator